ncbi:PLP-dependent aminotransferase family protein [Halomonas sp. McH1-25]|uniref:MocR-like pyridoxine biosynthesis transcription factor PdxR n=1 Tax=unclassified Halomonas TaxID=2609666 RepID=UPI001EF4C483|nr:MULTISPECIES: PLP-dependent aminotransferase family protein [unclassified Halomonas]MCG7599239.1 PLP-dependent aminotransferase family protein [Halomonas sp. McH1-25]MCP1341107.1 PLP-dependent aminotransferase family protein [Halomonas sp. FL8]MCP1360299.1 PLP-dependent aminotransferase family protein [Halomonas sp. BBD45]MCP1364417.1 PLP-dependent aminotransferase family protein [Halomonas sp. BBD48]
MNARCFPIEFDSTCSLQEQLRKALLDAILAGTLPADEPLPSCRKLSSQLNISRNTVALVYEGLVEDGYLVSRPRSGYYLHDSYRDGDAFETYDDESDGLAATRIDWQRRLSHRPSHYQGVLKPSRWQSFPYPFIYGQLDPLRFPLEAWRDVTRRLLGGRRERPWVSDRVDQDDPLLIEQLRTRVLPKRGILARSDEILVTLGSQNALFLVAMLLFTSRTRVGVESPGYREAVNAFAFQGAQLDYLTVDDEGLQLDECARVCDYLYTMPSHQVPTGITMSQARRQVLIAQIERHDQVVIEDDYDAELNVHRNALPALKASRVGHRVIYVSSFSKSLSPGMRLGYLVADAELIDELRALRRLMYRHPPASLQYKLAEFLAQGHYERHVRDQIEVARRRWATLHDALARHLPQCRRISDDYASAFWLQAPAGVDTQRLAWRAAQQGVLIEPGFQHFFDQAPPRNFLRLGFGAIRDERIVPGIERLAGVFGTG